MTRFIIAINCFESCVIALMSLVTSILNYNFVLERMIELSHDTRGKVGKYRANHRGT